MTKFDQLISDVKSLNLPQGCYALFGSAPIVVRGLREASHDIDIIVSEELWNHYKNKPGWAVRDIPCDQYLEWEGHDIEFWRSWGPGEWDISKMIKEAEIINGLPFVRLETVLKWKQLNGRPKDLMDVILIKDYLAR